MNLRVLRTQRGFSRVDFQDFYGKNCSLQKSSLATKDCIWLGANSGDHVDGACLARMHLTREQVRALLPLLHHFAETGELPEDNTWKEDEE